jgi:hypothetical protein
MSSLTPRVGFILPDDNDFVKEDDFNSNSTTIDSSLGVVWVADNALPVVKFHGALFKETGTKKEFILQSDGVGGFNKIPSGNATWVNIPLTSGYASQANFPVPQYRVQGGMCQLRGSVRFTTGTIGPGGVAQFCNGMPIPANVGDGTARVVLPAPFWDATPSLSNYGLGLINPRTDGGLRVYPPLTGPGWNLFGLDGLSYVV